MSDYKLEKDVPIPVPERRGRAEKYPFSKMEVGESFLVPSMKPEEKARSLYQYTQLKARALSKKFIVRAVQGGARVWRTE